MTPDMIRALLMAQGNPGMGQSTNVSRGTNQSTPDWWSFGARPRRESVQMAHGGDAQGALASDAGMVKGPGSGRDDLIPAMLADNEHVLDAEFVALVGDGSADEGHRRIEEMKAAVRAKKGRNLVKGAISDDAEPLTNYFGEGA